MNPAPHRTRPPLRAAALLLGAVLLLPQALKANLGGSDAAPDNRLEEARDLIARQEWQKAAQRLEMLVIATPDSADAHNFLGYTYRRMGNLDGAFREYAEALRLDPRHKAAHEYVGEAYLLAGKPARAEEHLAILRTLCSPLPCEEAKELRRAVDAYRKAHPQP